MSKITFYARSLVCCILFLLVMKTPGWAQIHLVKDLTTMPTSGVNSWDDVESEAAGQYVYFVGFSNLHGFELWKTDGTAQGTTMVKDITPGPDGSWIYNMINVNGVLFFAKGNELWKSDGSEQGAVKVEGIIAGGQIYDLPGQTAILNNKLFFHLRTSSASQLWVTNGAADGTTMVKEFNWIQEMAVSGGMLYISASNPNAIGLWKSDGASANTVYIPTNILGNPTNMTDVNGTLYFSAYTSNEGVELWKSNGTTASTSLVDDIRLGQVHSFPKNFVSTNGKLYFLADDGINGEELWVCNGATTSMVKNIGPGSASSAISGAAMIGANGQLYFEANDGVNGSELWKSDGTEQGTSLLLDIADDAGNSSPRYLTLFSGHVYFTAYSAEYGRELWRTDGTPAGTQLFKDVIEDAGSGDPKSMIALGTKLCFWADDGTHGIELWASDGSSQNTTFVKDISDGNESTYIERMVNTNGTLYFTNGQTLFKSDGSDGGTIAIEPYQDKIYYGELTGYADGVFYTVFNDNTNRWKLYKSDGSIGGGVEISPELVVIQSLKEVNGILYFAADDGTHGMELWKTNGALDGTSMVKDIHQYGGSYPGSFVAYKGALYFSAMSTAYGQELWKCEGGTELGTVMVKDIYPGPQHGNPGGFTEYNGRLYFMATHPDYSQELWSTDGTDQGTSLLIDGCPGPNRGAGGHTFAKLNNTLYYLGFAPDGNGMALWKTDGTTNGSSVVFDPESIYINYLAEMNGTLYLETGSGIWTSDGSTEGTKKLIDFPASALEMMEVHNGHLFFAYNGELWKSDGDVCNTFAVNKKNEVAAIINMVNPISIGDRLYFTGISEANGTELFYYDFSTINTPGCTQTVSMDDIPQKVYGDLPFDITAAASTGMPVTITSSNTNIATVNRNTITIVGAGEVTFTATQPGDNRYATAAAEKTITIAKATQSITFAELIEKSFDSTPFNLNATAGSGLPISYSSSDPSVATVSGNQITIKSAGTVVITASQNGNENYEAATSVTRNLIVKKGTQTLIFGELSEKIYGELPFNIDAVSSVGLTVTFTSADNTVATVSGNTVTLVGAGETTITASQQGNSQYEAATPVARTLIVKLITGIEPGSQGMISIYPNPAVDFLMLEGNILRENTVIQLHDAQGRSIQTKTETADGRSVVDMRSLDNGIYYLSIVNGRTRTTQKIVKNN